MRVLAVDTTSADGSVALLDGGSLVGIEGFRAQKPQHAEHLLPTVRSVLEQSGSSMEEVDGIAAAAGPGSFVGIRIGLASVRGLSFGLGIPAVGVSTLEATAHTKRHHAGVIAAVLEAYRGEVYAAVYRSDGRECTVIREPTCMTAEALLDELPEPPSLITGNGVARRAELFSLRCPDAVLTEPSNFLAESVGRLGSAQLARGALHPTLSAIYVRAPEAERKRSLGPTGA